MTRAETRFRLSAKWASLFKSAWTSVQTTTGSRVVRIIGSNAGYTKFRGSVKGTGYPLHSPVSPSLPLPCVTVCHHISSVLYHCVMTHPKVYKRQSHVAEPPSQAAATCCAVVRLSLEDNCDETAPVHYLNGRHMPLSLCSDYFCTLMPHGMGRGNAVGIATRYGLDGPGSNPGGGEIIRTPQDRPWGPPSLLYNGYRVFPGAKAAGAWR